MNLEINIKVPLGEGVSLNQGEGLSVSQRTQPGVEGGYEPPPITELSRQEADYPTAEAPPPTLEELETLLATGRTETTPEAQPPSLSALDSVHTSAVVEHEPPSLEMLEPGGQVTGAPDFLGLVASLNTGEMPPPPIEEIEGIPEAGPPSPQELVTAAKQPAAKKRSTRRTKGKS